MSTAPLLEVQGLKKYFLIKRDSRHPYDRTLKAVDGVNLIIRNGETVGLVGESGCGKSTLGRCILRLYDDGITAGKILFEGTDITDFSEHDMRPYRPKMQIIFQDPMSALNPRKTVFQSVCAPLDVTGGLTDEQKYEKVVAAVEEVGLREEDLTRYPHEMSGGQRQRVVIARAMICHPDLIVCDEPVSALDVSVRAQVLNLLNEIQQKEQISYLFISHDLSVVQYLCSKVAVMYLGRIVEIASREKLFSRPLHPYTRALLSAIPIPDIHRQKSEVILEGEVPSPIDPPKGCRFNTRCPFAEERCRQEEPQLEEIDPEQSCACFRVRQFLDEYRQDHPSGKEAA